MCGPDDERSVEQFARARLLRVAEAHPTVFDVGITGVDKDTPAIRRTGKKAVERAYKKFRVAPDDFSVTLPEYRYVLSVEGVAASWRGRQLFASGAVVMLQHGRWAEFFQAELQPWVHYVPVAPDFSDLVESYLWLEAHPVEAEALALAALDFSRTSLAPLATECYALEAARVLSKAAKYVPADENELLRQGYLYDFPPEGDPPGHSADGEDEAGRRSRRDEL